MTSARRCSLPLLSLALAIAMTACAAEEGGTAVAPEPTDAPTAASADDADDMAMDDLTEDEETHSEEEDFEWGIPAEAAEATRTIEIEADDDFTFAPAEVQVEAGETVTFSVTNVGQLEHDFTLGDGQTQQAHEEEMAEMGDMAHGAEEQQLNALSISPGETVETTWTFMQPGEILIGCHVPGHYDAGMRGTVTIAGGA